MKDATLIERAAAFARKAHQGQTRKYSGIPYVTHPEAVAHLVAERTDKPELIAAAYLHDTMEDCGVSCGEIAGLFGAEVAEIVSSLTNDEQRKAVCGKVAYMTDKLRSLSPEALLVKLCDTFHNITETPNQHQALNYKLIVEGVLACRPAGWNEIHEQLAASILATYSHKWGEVE